MVATPSNIDRKVYFLERALSQLIENTTLDARYTSAERIMNIGTGIDYIDIASFFNHREYRQPPGSETTYYKTAAQIKKMAFEKQVSGGCNI